MICSTKEGYLAQCRSVRGPKSLLSFGEAVVFGLLLISRTVLENPEKRDNSLNRSSGDSFSLQNIMNSVLFGEYYLKEDPLAGRSTQQVKIEALGIKRSSQLINFPSWRIYYLKDSLWGDLLSRLKFDKWKIMGMSRFKRLTVTLVLSFFLFFQTILN